MAAPLSPLLLPSSPRFSFRMSPSTSPSPPPPPSPQPRSPSHPPFSPSPPSPRLSLYTLLGLATAPPPTTAATSESPPSPATSESPPSPASPASSLYTVLGLAAEATPPEIKAAYRRMARACHPDIGGGTNSGDFIRVRDAYSTLSDPRKRADYDRKLSSPPPPLPLYHRRVQNAYSGASSGGFCSYGRRNWESDQCW